MSIVPNRESFFYTYFAFSGGNPIRVALPWQAVSLQLEIHAALLDFFFLLRLEGLWFHKEYPFLFHLSRLQDMVLYLEGPFRSQEPQSIVAHPGISKHELFHLWRRQILGNPDEISGFREFL